MNLRWLKKYSTVLVPDEGGTLRPVMIPEKVLQVEQDGEWVDVPVVEDLVTREKAREIARELKSE